MTEKREPIADSVTIYVIRSHILYNIINDTWPIDFCSKPHILYACDIVIIKKY
jgi:hypothetical protein